MAVDQYGQVVDTITGFLQENFSPAGGAIGLDEKLYESGIVDSFGLLVIIRFLEETYGIIVSDTEVLAENFESVAAIARYVSEKQTDGASDQ